MIKKFNEFSNVKENVELAQPAVKPKTTPKTTPTPKPGKPSPFRKDKPSVVPKPKASAEDVANKFLELTKNDESTKYILRKKYLKNESLNEKAKQDLKEEDIFEIDNNGKITLKVEIKNIDKSTAKDFLKMFKFMEWCGNVGAGRSLKAYFDGDGHFRPKIKVEGINLKDIEFINNEDDWEGDEINLGFGA